MPTAHAPSSAKSKTAAAKPAPAKEAAAKEKDLAARPALEEISHRSDQVYLCLVINRRHKSARIVDYLSGNFPTKQMVIQQICVREGIERVYTLVEREESAGWTRVGFAREGSIPGYYKRSDAYVLGHVIHDPPTVTADGTLVAPSADGNKAERTILAARKAKEDLSPKSVKTRMLSEDEMLAEAKALPAKGRKHVQYVDDRFVKIGPRFHVGAKDPRARNTPEQFVSAEVQECFGNAYVQLAQFPANEAEARCVVAALNTVVEHLKTQDVASAFVYAPSHDVVTAQAMLAAGYKKTGLLAQHLLVDGKRVDAILWSRKTGIATDGEG